MKREEEKSQRESQERCGCKGKGKERKVKGRREGKWNGREQLGRKQKRRLMVASAVVREETRGESKSRSSGRAACRCRWVGV